jgi:dTMP kinase
MFISFEGMDGSGKTTQVNLAADYLRKRGYEVLLTREPGGTTVGDRIRAILMDKETEQLNPRAELLLFNASRAQLVDEVIRPHLARGGVVICDRYIDSSIAYQGYGHGIDLQYVIDAVTIATDGLLPELTVYLDITPEEGLKRRASASLFGEEFTRIDAMALEYHQRVYRGYTEIGQSQPERWLRVDAAQPPEQVHKDVLKALKQRLPTRKPRARPT